MGLHLNETDELLFARLKDSNEKAFNVLYQRYWDKLLELAFYKLQSQEEAEEVVQQVFVDIWNNREQTQLKYTFRTYISAAVKYTVMAKLAQRKKSRSVSIDEHPEDSFIDDSTQQWLTFNDMRDELETLINQLPEKCGLVFRMSREDGLSTKEIATELNISTKAVEAHITRAIKALKSGLNQFFIFLF